MHRASERCVQLAGHRLKTRLVTLAALIGAAAAIVFATPAYADSAGPTDYRSAVVSVSPATSAVAIEVVGGDAFVRIVVRQGHEVIVSGYDGEPYLRITADGVVQQNRYSYATYYNEDRWGRTEIPSLVDNDAPPAWDTVGTGGTWAWHDHRSHWMSPEPPIGLRPGQSLPPQTIPLTVDGKPVSVVVVATLQSSPSPWPMVAAIAFGALFAIVLVRRGSFTLVASGVLVLAAAALIVGAAQYRSLPPETGPRTNWWSFPALAVVLALGALVWRRGGALSRRSVVASAAVLVTAWGLLRVDGLFRAVLPTDLPFWFDRFTTAAAIVGGLTLIVAALAPVVAALMSSSRYVHSPNA